MVSGCADGGDKMHPPPSEVPAQLVSGQLLMERRREEDIYYSSSVLDGDMENMSFKNIAYGRLHAAHCNLYRDDPKGTAHICQKMCSAIVT